MDEKLRKERDKKRYRHIGKRSGTQLGEPLSVAIASIYDGKGYRGGTAHGSVPYLDTALTAGRKIIKSIFDLKQPNELRLR